MTLGTQQNPLRTTEPMKIARTMLKARFEGGKGLKEVQGRLFEWYGGKWEQRDRVWLEDCGWQWLEDLHVADDADGLVVKRFSPTEMKVGGVVRALEALVRVQVVSVPMWLDRLCASQVEDVGCTMSFRDFIVDVKASARTGEVVKVVRGPEWFDPCVMNVDLDLGAECPRWHRCLKEWSGGDEVWVELLRRWMGYCCMAHRRYAKWMLFHGKTRAGKGTIATVLRWLLGHQGFFGTSLDEVAGAFGLDGLEFGRVLCVSEVSELGGREGEVAVRVLKNILGRDPVSINAKYKRQTRNVVLGAAPMMQANEIPKLSNKGRGLSSKMLVLPFEFSFEGKEQHDLMDVLAEELTGIAAWVLGGAIALEGAPSMEKFVQPGRSEEVTRDYHLANNKMDDFLEARFLKNAGGFVANELLRHEWKDWVKKHPVGEVVGLHQLPKRIRVESSWSLQSVTSSCGVKGLRGLSLRKEHNDEG